jgi:GMP synthase-like glutamine amidotransferase
MYIFVAVQEKEHYYANGPSGRTKARLELASEERCLVVPYQEFDMALVQDLKPRAIVMGGFGGHFQSRKVEWFLGINDVIHQADLPILCFCGSHQVLGFSFNRDLQRVKQLRDEPIRKIKPNEGFPRRAQGDPKFDLSGYFVAEGFFPITRIKPDPLFRGLPKKMIMRCSHYCEVKRLPPSFELLASSAHCRIEAMRHQDKLLYGTQFHPEAYEAPFSHGRRLLENFANIVRDFWVIRDSGRAFHRKRS